ncbi:MAG: metal ABC transporter substrate-binding protein [Micrococcales bacterium]|nr:metal ABC transporter substrate-binding protein [Micrococcales bacterium]
MKSPPWRTMAALAIVLTLTPGCSDLRQDGWPLVVTTFWAMDWVAIQVATPDADVDNLTATSAEPHDLELSPAGVAWLGVADIVVIVGGFQPAVDQAVAEARPARVVDLAALTPGTPTNPHLWLDPIALLPLVTALGDALAEADPDRESAYRERQEALVTRLVALDQEISHTLAGCDITTFVTDHDAFSSFASRYGLTQISIAGIDPEAEPSPARLREVASQAREAGVTTVFYEASGSDASARAVAELAGGLEVAAIDPMEFGGGDYLDRMRANAAALSAANACQGTP